MIDRKIHHIDAQSFDRLGAWLCRKYRDCQQKNVEARNALQKLGIQEREYSTIRKDWESARRYYTSQIPSNVLLPLLTTRY